MRLSTRHFDAQNAKPHICKRIEEGEGKTRKQNVHPCILQGANTESLRQNVIT